MQMIRPVGREAAARKYDALSALMALALASDPHRQRLIWRFLALVTTRYNWQRDELTMGQREIARLWCVDERTVKRDMARLRETGWIVVKRQGARGRVSVLGLGLERIMLDTRADWSNIGKDFTARMGEEAQEAGDPPNVVPFRRPDGRQTVLAPGDVRFVPRRRWRSPVSGGVYPVEAEFVVRLPEGVRRFPVKPLFDAQELDGRAAGMPIYWEGAVSTPGGRGYLELTGYAGALTL